MKQEVHEDLDRSPVSCLMRSCLKTNLFLALLAIFFIFEADFWGNFGREHYEEHLSENFISILDHWFRRNILRFFLFSALVAI